MNPKFLPFKEELHNANKMAPPHLRKEIRFREFDRGGRKVLEAIVQKADGKFWAYWKPEDGHPVNSIAATEEEALANVAALYDGTYEPIPVQQPPGPNQTTED